MRKVGLIGLIAVCLGILFFIGVAAAAEKVSKITPEQLKTMLDDPNGIIIDVRLGPDWIDSQISLSTALWGQISVYSRPGTGTKVTTVLPSEGSRT